MVHISQFFNLMNKCTKPVQIKFPYVLFKGYYAV